MDFMYTTEKCVRLFHFACKLELSEMSISSFMALESKLSLCISVKKTQSLWKLLSYLMELLAIQSFAFRIA